MWDLVPGTGIKPRPPALEAWRGTIAGPLEILEILLLRDNPREMAQQLKHKGLVKLIMVQIYNRKMSNQ